MTGRKLLFLVPFPPRLDAQHGGSRVVAQLISRLAERHRVAVLALRAEDELTIDDTLRDRCEHVEEVPRRLIGRSLRRAWTERTRVQLLLAGSSHWLAGTAVARYEARLRELVRSWEPEVVQIEFRVMAQYLPALDGCPAARVLVEHDPPLRSPLARRRERVWARLESSAVSRLDAVVVFTERDRAGLAGLAAAARIIRIAPGTELPARPLDPLGSPPPTVLFFGNFAHKPNVEAARRLTASIFPRVLEHHRETRLAIVGAEPPAELRRASSERVVVTGAVPDLTPYLNDAAVVVAPLSEGGGMRVKVLETLAAGKALVASPLAVEGLALVDGEHVLLGQGDEELGGAVSRLLDDESLRKSLATSARSWACAHLDWQGSVEAYEELYDAILERAGR